MFEMRVECMSKAYHPIVYATIPFVPVTGMYLYLEEHTSSMKITKVEWCTTNNCFYVEVV